jgi:hypothetical protein
MPEWHKYPEFKPEDEQSVLMIDSLMSMIPSAGYYGIFEGIGGFFSYDCNVRQRVIVTHWMPLLSPPEDK